MTKEEVMKIWKAEVGKYDLGNGYSVEIYDKLYSKGTALEGKVEARMVRLHENGHLLAEDGANYMDDPDKQAWGITYALNELLKRTEDKELTIEEGVEKAHQEFKGGDTEEGEICTLGYIVINGERYDMWYSWSIPFWYDREKEEVNIMKKKQHTIGIEKRYKDVPRKSRCATAWSFSKKAKEEMVEKLKEATE